MLVKSLGIDLGTTNTLVYVPKKGIIINEPTVVALSAADNKILAVGRAAKDMLGRTPESIIANHPLRDGAIADYFVTEALLRYFVNKVIGAVRLFKPEILVSISAGLTSTEKRAVIDATTHAGAKNAYVIKEPIAAALGADIPIAAPSGHMIIDIGGGTTEVAVLALGDIVASSSVRVGGMRFDQDIASYVRKKYNLIIGERTAEELKIKIGSTLLLKKELKMEISGSNVISGLPESIMVSSTDVAEACRDGINEIIGAVKGVLQHTPPELSADVIDKGIVVTGGGALLRKIHELFSKVIGVNCEVAENPLLCVGVVKGTGIAVENLEAYKKSILWARNK